MSQRSGNVALKRMLEVAMGDAKYVLHGPCVQRGHIIGKVAYFTIISMTCIPYFL